MNTDKLVLVVDTTKRCWGRLEDSRLRTDSEVLNRIRGCPKDVSILVLCHISDIGARVDSLMTFLKETQAFCSDCSVVIYSGDPNIVLKLKNAINIDDFGCAYKGQFAFYPQVVANSVTTDAYKEFEGIIDEWLKGGGKITDVVEAQLKSVDHYEALDAFRLLLGLAILKMLDNGDELLSSNSKLSKVRESLCDDVYFWENIWTAFPPEKVQIIIKWFDKVADVDKTPEEKDLIGCMQQVDDNRKQGKHVPTLDGYLKRYFTLRIRKMWKVTA